jgi:L-lactate dehydrogenase complex protein LldG
MPLMNSREKVLNRVRASLGRSAPASERERERAQAYMNEHLVGPQPAPELDLVASFEQQSKRLSATVDRVSSLADVPAAVAAYLAREGLGREAVCWPAYVGLDWAGSGLTVAGRAPSRDMKNQDLVGITGCFAAVAETGTLAMVSGPDSPASMNLLPETHIAVVPTDRIVAFMEDVFRMLRKERGGMPRALNFISGPSRTADIEQTLVLGAHGPYRVHLLLMESDPS